MSSAQVVDIALLGGNKNAAVFSKLLGGWKRYFWGWKRLVLGATHQYSDTDPSFGISFTF